MVSGKYIIAEATGIIPRRGRQHEQPLWADNGRYRCIFVFAERSGEVG